ASSLSLGSRRLVWVSVRLLVTVWWHSCYCSLFRSLPCLWIYGRSSCRQFSVRCFGISCLFRRGSPSPSEILRISYYWLRILSLSQFMPCLPIGSGKRTKKYDDVKRRQTQLSFTTRC